MDSTDARFLIDAIDNIEKRLETKVGVVLDDEQVDSILTQLAKPIDRLRVAVEALSEAIALSVVAQGNPSLSATRAAKNEILRRAGMSNVRPIK